MFTKRHFEKIAALLKRRIETHADASHWFEDLAHEFADVFEDSNELFDRDRFLKAAGVQSWRDCLNAED